LSSSERGRSRKKKSRKRRGSFYRHPEPVASPAPPSNRPSTIRERLKDLQKTGHTVSVENTAITLDVVLETGLSEEAAAYRLKRYGKNRLKSEKVSPLKILLAQVLNVVMVILLIAALLSYITQQWVEAGVITFVMVFNIVVGFIQEFRSAKTMESLLKCLHQLQEYYVMALLRKKVLWK